MIPDEIENQEILHRAIRQKPCFWKKDKDRPSSALFKDSKGVSVDRCFGRTEAEVKESLINRLGDLKGEARVKVSTCRDKLLRVISNKEENNCYHSLILGETKIELTTGQARYLARNCDSIEY